MEKHDSKPLIRALLCHSEVNRQIIHQWDSLLLPPQLPLSIQPALDEQRQQSAPWLANEELGSS